MAAADLSVFSALALLVVSNQEFDLPGRLVRPLHHNAPGVDHHSSPGVPARIPSQYDVRLVDADLRTATPQVLRLNPDHVIATSNPVLVPSKHGQDLDLELDPIAGCLFRSHFDLYRCKGRVIQLVRRNSLSSQTRVTIFRQSFLL